MGYRILVVDDEYQIREGSAAFLREEFPEETVETASNGKKALEIIMSRPVDVMFLDVKMRGMDGLELLEELDRRHLTPVTAMVSGFSDFDFAKKAMEYGAKKYLVKPFTPDELSLCLRELLNYVVENDLINRHRQENDSAEENARSRPEEIRRFLDEHYAEELSVKTIADRFGLNADYLGKLFKKEFSVSINEYISKARVDQAVNLFQSTGMNVSEVAEKVGFKDQTYFSTVFKSVTGQTPSQYKK